MTITMDRPQTSGNDRIRNSDYLLGTPAAARDAEALEADRARRIVQRLGGQHAPELLDMLGLMPESNTEPTARTTGKRCSTCKETKPRTEYYKRARASDGLYSQCKTCHNGYDKKKRIRARKKQPNGRIIECESCGRTEPHEAHGWCRACCQRWNRAGRPDDGPPPSRYGRYEEYFELTRVRRYSQARAAAEMGVHLRTAQRYELRIEQEAA